MSNELLSENTTTQHVQLRSTDGTVTVMRAEEVLRYFCRRMRRQSDAPVLKKELFDFIRDDLAYTVSPSDMDLLAQHCVAQLIFEVK